MPAPVAPKLPVGTLVDTYTASGGQAYIFQSQAEIVGYARNEAYVVQVNGCTHHQHVSLVREAGQLMPTSWIPRFWHG